MYEPYGKSTNDKLDGFADKNIWETNLLENEEKKTNKLSFGEFEIKTIKLDINDFR